MIAYGMPWTRNTDLLYNYVSPILLFFLGMTAYSSPSHTSDASAFLFFVVVLVYTIARKLIFL
jgi:hypothetical protein